MDNVGFVRLWGGRRLDILPFYLTVIFAALIISRINMARDIGRPFGGFLSFYNVLSSGGEEYIKGGNPPWWTPFESGRLTYSDRIATINGQKYQTPGVGELYARLWEAGQRTAELYLWRPGGHQTVTISLQLFTLTQFLEVSTANFLVSLGFWLTAVVIYRGQPFEPLNRITALLAGAAAGYGGTTANALFGGQVGVTLEMVSLFFLGLIGPATIHLALYFPRSLTFLKVPRFRVAYHLSLKLLYGAGIGFSLLYILSKVLFRNGADIDLVEGLDRTAFYSLYRLVGLAYLAFVIRLLYSGLKDPSPRHRRESALLLVGMVGCFLAIYFLVGRVFVDLPQQGYWGRLQLNFLLLALPITLCIIILRYKTFRPLSAFFMIAPLLMISALLATTQTVLAVSTNVVPDSKGIFLFLSGFAVVFLSSAIWSYQSSWQGFFRRLLQWERTTIEDVKRFGAAMLTQQDLAELPATIAKYLCENLELERAAVWIWQEGDFELVSQDGSWAMPLPSQLHRTGIPDSPLRLTRLSRQLGVPLADREEVEVLVPLWVTASPVGLLALGKRWDEAAFDERDLDSIALVGQQAALFMLSSRQIQRLRQVPQQLSEAQERERNRLAQELHDTAEQFLGRLPFALEEIRAELLEDPEKADRLIESCLMDINQEAGNLRQIRHSMAPIQLEHGFTPALEQLIENFRKRTGASCNVEVPDDFEEYLPANARLPLYRVIQQALDNVVEHAKADLVDIRLSIDEEGISFQIVDDGRGSSENIRRQAQVNGSFGLMSMEARILNLGGNFKYESTLGKGTKVSGWISGSI
ncbi:MAG: ATP-binding protein [Candidatus Promineifilaceae bacterium]